MESIFKITISHLNAAGQNPVSTTGAPLTPLRRTGGAQGVKGPTVPSSRGRPKSDLIQPVCTCTAVHVEEHRHGNLGTYQVRTAETETATTPY